MEERVQGNISIRIAEDEMTAFLDFSPSQVLNDWNDNIILDLLKKAGVEKGYKTFHFPRILDKIKKLNGSGSFEIAFGLEPTTEAISKFNFKKHPMDASLESTYGNLVEKFGKPEVFAVGEDYSLGIEPEKVPFVVLNHFYVNEGDVIAEIDDQSKPKNGYTVTGKVLEPEVDENSTKFCSDRIFSFENGVVKSKESGFVRLGKNWMDLIPFKGHNIKIIPSDDFGEYYLSFTPGVDDAPLPLYSDIISKFDEIAFPVEYLKNEEEIFKGINKALQTKKTIKFSITKKRKSHSEIEINQSKTKAVLHLVKGAGVTEKLSLKEIGVIIRNSKIKGMNLDAVKQRILQFYKSPDLELKFTILEGKPATRGEARRLKFKKEFISVEKIGGIVDRIDNSIEAYYPSFKTFKKDDISSAIIVRKGGEFAELTDPVPGDDGTDIYGNKIKGLVGNDPIIKTFENITVKQNMYISDIDGILDLGEVNGETLLRVREHKDMFVDITVSKDAMSASFTFYKAFGSGEEASLDFILTQIEDAGVVKGIDKNIVEESYNRFKDGELISEVVFAKGRIPTDKKSSRIKFDENSSGETTFSYEVEKGSKIGTIFPSKEKAEDGYDVLGTIMEASGVVSLDMEIGDYILEEPQEDESINLIADINGELQVTEESIKIVDKKVMSTDVTAKTGSIKTLCSLIIKGSVNSSLYVMSGGNIKIMGTVQGALISADKNIIIAQGVKGENKAVLRAKEKIDVKFIEQGNMMAVEDIHIRKAAMHSKIISNGKVIFDSGNTKVVGGEINCKKGLIVDDIGSPSGSKCLISFGQDYLVADKIKVFENEVDKIQQNLLRIDQILVKPGKGLNQDKVTHLRKQKVFLMKKLEKINMKLFLLREKFEEHAPSEIVIRNRIYPGVVFESHGRTLEINEDIRSCKIIFNPGTGQIERK